MIPEKEHQYTLGGSVALNPEKDADLLPQQPAVLYALLAATPHRVGDLVDFAQSIPRTWIEPLISALYAGVTAESDQAKRRRKLIILGVLTERLIFEVENIPKRRSAII